MADRLSTPDDRVSDPAHVNVTPHGADETGYWIQPPPAAKGGSLPMVDLRFCLLKVSSVDTVAGTAFVKIQTISYWTDPRLIGWSEDRMLPPALWGPRMWLHNALGDMQAEDDEFALIDPTGGRVKRVRIFAGTVDNPMDLVRCVSNPQATPYRATHCAGGRRNRFRSTWTE
jgi:hypothetical protein